MRRHILARSLPPILVGVLSTLFGLLADASAAENVGPSDSGDEFFKLSLEDLVRINISTVTFKAQSLEEAPSSVVIITRSDILKYGFRTVGEALSFVAGFDVLSDYERTDVGTRGVHGDINSNGSLLAVLVDGMDTSFRSTGANSFGYDQVPLAAVDHIEKRFGRQAVLGG